MKLKKLLAIAVAAAFALPFAGQASAAGDSLILAQGPSGASSTGTGPTGGTPSPQTAGEPKAPGDTKADSRRCDNMTGTERETCLRDSPRAGSTGAAAGSTGSATGGATTSPSGAVVTPGGSGTTGTTAGPGETKPGTAPSSATATSPDTSGTGKAK
jgi:hypothetical protein